LMVRSHLQFVLVNIGHKFLCWFWCSFCALWWVSRKLRKM
jgi:hypothetical protein